MNAAASETVDSDSQPIVMPATDQGELQVIAEFPEVLEI